MKVLTNFMSMTTGEGSRVAFTYSEIDETSGAVVSTNNKGNFMVLDEGVQSHIDAVRAYIKKNYLKEE